MVNIRFGLVVASIRKFPSPEGWNTGILWGENYHLTDFTPYFDSFRVKRSGWNSAGSIISPLIYDNYYHKINKKMSTERAHQRE